MTRKTYLTLSSSVQYIKGIGPKRASCLYRLGVQTVRDLLYFVPRRYVDYSSVMKIKDLQINDEATVIGKIILVENRKTRGHMRGSMIKLLLQDETAAIGVKWFNRPDLKNKFMVSDWLIISGKVSYYHGHQFVNPLYEVLDREEIAERKSGTIIPVYPLTEGLSIWNIRRSARIALDACRHEIKDSLPIALRRKNDLIALPEALQQIHFPSTTGDASQARRRLVYDEFFYFELMLARRRSERTGKTGIQLKETGALTREFLQILPFSLTKGQHEVISQITRNMAETRPMNRLLQGDVGSGKTVVALYAMLVAVENGYQAALMAPTEILAEQHYLGLSIWLKRLGVHASLLTSSLSRSDKEQSFTDIKTGRAHIIFGTHALIEGNIEFKKLGMVVIDEQHRFGVMQRAELVNKGINPDFIVLSATPIPRTLALTLYGDLDISSLQEKPPRRGEVLTRIVKANEIPKMNQVVQDELKKNHQAFVICPVIEKSEKHDLKSVNEVYHDITGIFPDFSVGIIHGRLPTSERIEIMSRFRDGTLQILVATTVIEVGVDIPNATLMIIEHPERFGLAQLHQLRGRIGRGAEKSYCFLFLDRYVAPETYERISYFASSNDGFALAQKDMKLRGPGEILGKRQHGLPDIKIGDLEEDQEILFRARDDAFAVIQQDPEMNMPEHALIKEYLDQVAEGAELLRIG